MAQVSRSVALKAAPEAVWGVIGGFQALPDWHPAVASSAKEAAVGVERRRLALHGGGEILEESLGAGPMSYGYRILSGPLPVAEYVSVLTVAPAPGGAVVVWSSTFAPTAPDAEAVMGGVYDAGLAALAERFGRA
jgi:hypothetical protein